MREKRKKEKSFVVNILVGFIHRNRAESLNTGSREFMGRAQWLSHFPSWRFTHECLKSTIWPHRGLSSLPKYAGLFTFTPITRFSFSPSYNCQAFPRPQTYSIFGFLQSFLLLCSIRPFHVLPFQIKDFLLCWPPIGCNYRFVHLFLLSFYLVILSFNRHISASPLVEIMYLYHE